MSGLRTSLAGLIGVTVLAASGPARAAEPAGPAECVATYDAALDLKKRGELLASHARFSECTLPVCPGPVREECAEQIRQLASMIPTVVPAARARSGGELVEVSVQVDGRLLTERIDGRAHRLDPGPHQFRFETAGAEPRVVSVVLAEGDRLRRIEAVLDTGGEPAGEPAPIPTLAWVLGGVGVAGLLGFTYFGLSGLSEESELEKCEPNCRPERTDDLKRTYLFADISLAIGVAALGGATYVYLTRGSSDQALVGIGGRF
jgi:hypothetical protein